MTLDSLRGPRRNDVHRHAVVQLHGAYRHQGTPGVERSGDHALVALLAQYLDRYPYRLVTVDLVDLPVLVVAPERIAGHQPALLPPNDDVGTKTCTANDGTIRCDIHVELMGVWIECRRDTHDLTDDRLPAIQWRQRDAFARYDPTQHVELKPGAHDDPFRPGQREQRNTRLQCIALRHRNAFDDTVEWRVDVYRRMIALLLAQGFEIRVRVAGRLVCLIDLVACGQLLRQELRGMRARLISHSHSALCLSKSCHRRRRQSQRQQVLAPLDRQARRNIQMGHRTRRLYIERGLCIWRRYRHTVGRHALGQARLSHRHRLDLGVHGFPGSIGLLPAASQDQQPRQEITATTVHSVTSCGSASGIPAPSRVANATCPSYWLFSRAIIVAWRVETALARST